VEAVHRGAVAVVEGTRLVFARGDVEGSFFLRSCAKPFQAASVVECGDADAFGLTPPELAVMAASHGGEAHQRRAALSILRKAGVLPSALRCGAHPPYSAQALRALHRSGGAPTALHNNCSGKHAGMLAAARHLRAPMGAYLDPRHAVQRLNRLTLARFAGVLERSVVVAVDGCGAPTFALPLRVLARAAASLVAGEGAAGRIIEAVTGHPEMAGRPCCDLMRAAPRKILAKAGAEGMYVCGLPGKAIGIAVKFDDGSLRAVVHVVVAIIRRLGLLDRGDRERLRRSAEPLIRNHSGQEVGEIRVRL
jgi:L-asparaginase II